ncbi:hypothetical protein GCM10011508_21930 [Flavobacterium lutivivi]|nr:hypothetical protein GCM10011508_21930 [Flavobacterium lutivivi]
MNKLLIVYFFLILFTVCSCSDDDVPGITILTPTNGQNFNAGQIVEVKVKISDDGDSIMNEELYVIHENDTIVNFSDDEFAFDYIITESFVVENSSEYKIVARARGGHGNWGSKTIYINSQ